MKGRVSSLLEEAAREPEKGRLGGPADVFLVGAEAGSILPLRVEELEGTNDFTTALKVKFEERGKVSASAHISACIMGVCAQADKHRQKMERRDFAMVARGT